MKLDTFLHQLHYETNKLSPPDWEVDWEDAPLPYKLYCDLPVFPLSSEVPFTLDERVKPSKPELRAIGHFLWYVYGLVQVSQSLDSENLRQSFRRFAPSGGALYPNELYMYLKLEGLPCGVYHYDVAHHQLVLLREGNFDAYISDALGNRCDTSTCFATVFVSAMFWKNFFKYHYFSYRLQGMDAGVLIGQLLEVSKRFGYETGVYFQFLDRAINHLLGLRESEESIYGVIPLSVESTEWFQSSNGKDEVRCATELCREIPAIECEHYVFSKKIKEYPMLIQMNEASMMESTKYFRPITVGKNKKFEEKEVKLSPVKRLPYDLAAVCRKRFSPEMDFVLGKVSQWQLATLLQEAIASFSYRNDLDETITNEEPRVTLYGCFYQVENIPNGAYVYDSKAHALRTIQLGDYRSNLQYAMTLDNVNLQQVPLCLHVAGEIDHYKTALGYRGYRIQQMEAGMLVQRLLLTASAIGLGGHPLLGFIVNMCDDIYKMNQHGQTSLIQIPIGSYRERPWLRGGLHN
ncbi:MAG: SagB family peptide dehydrogenase [Bacillus sp. (in: firmicutes)]